MEHKGEGGELVLSCVVQPKLSVQPWDLSTKARQFESPCEAYELESCTAGIYLFFYFHYFKGDSSRPENILKRCLLIPGP